MKQARSACNPLGQRAAQLIVSFLVSAPSRRSYRKDVLKPLSVILYLLSVSSFFMVPEAAKAVLFCLRADELGSVPSQERSLLQIYLNAKFDEKIKRIVRINTHYFLIPTSTKDCSRCFYRLVFVDDKVTDVAVLVGAGAVWMVPEDSYPYLGNHYTGFTIGGGEQMSADIYIQVPNVDGTPVVEIRQRREMRAPNCKLER
jgi:hypothetical protein